MKTVQCDIIPMKTVQCDIIPMKTVQCDIIPMKTVQCDIILTPKAKLTLYISRQTRPTTMAVVVAMAGIILPAINLL